MIPLFKIEMYHKDTSESARPKGGIIQFTRLSNIEEKMRIHGSTICFLNFGDNGDCYA
jgi:hypothetical protein